MPPSYPSDCFSGFEPDSGTAEPARRTRKERLQQLACDRCRGQKLRCIRTANPDASCQRCQKAGATCIVDSSVRMGRPRRSDKEQLQSSRGTGTGTGTGTGSTAVGSSCSYNSNPPRTQPRKHSPGPTLGTASSQTTGTSGGYSPIDDDTWPDDTIDPSLRGAAVQYLEAFDFSLPAEHYLDTCSSLDASLGHQSVNSIGALPVTDAEAMAIDPAATVINGDNRLIQMRQETMQELSDLNMQFYQQLSAIAPMTSKHTTAQPGFRGRSTAMLTPPDGSNTLSDAVVFMMHGLQTYHKLLLRILASTTSTTPTHVSSAEPNAAMLHDSSDSSQNSAVVDLPTSLLLLSCHTNLMHLCRDALAAIRVALLATHRQITLLTISILHIDETAIPPDPELQVIVLTQAVIRLTDRIGRMLGYSNDCEGYSGSERGEEAETRSSAISPQLVHLVLRWEAGENGPADRGGMEALREEIRKLHEIVYQPI